MTAAQRAAADEIVTAIIEALPSDRGVHAKTAIASAKRMGGTFLFRSFGFALAVYGFVEARKRRSSTPKRRG